MQWPTLPPGYAEVSALMKQLARDKSGGFVRGSGSCTQGDGGGDGGGSCIQNVRSETIQQLISEIRVLQDLEALHVFLIF